VGFQWNAERLNQIVQALADTAPAGWRKLVFYMELVEDAQIGLRNSFTGRVFGGPNFDTRLDSYQLGRSVQTFNAIKALYQEAAQQGDNWAGVRLTVLHNGQFKLRFYYDQTPLLADDDAALEQILSEGLSELPHSHLLPTANQTAAPVIEEIYQLIKAHQLFKVIRGEQGVFRTPAYINADLLPTDHNELLTKAIYPIAEKYNAKFVERELDMALRVAASDALGVYCAIQCYYMQIVNEAEGLSSLRLDRVSLPQYLTARYFAVVDDLKALNLSGNDAQDYAQRSALSYLAILDRDYGVQVTA